MHTTRLCIIVFAALIAACVTSNSGSGLGVSSSGGTTATIEQPIDRVEASTKSALESNGVEVTETKRETEGDRRTVKGKKGDYAVTVELGYNGTGSTKVDVTAREHLVTYDKTFSQKLLDDIVAGAH